MRVYHVRTNIDAGADNRGGNSLNKSFKSYDKMVSYVDGIIADEVANGYTIDGWDEDQVKVRDGKDGTLIELAVCWDDFIDAVLSVRVEDID